MADVVILIPGDLTPFATIDVVKAQAMIDDAMALAARVAPCILTPNFAFADAAKAILRGAILRWNEAGAGATTAQTTGPFSQTLTTAPRRSMFWPSEITDLQALCSDGASVSAFTIDTAPYAATGNHSAYCSLNFGGADCSCGAVLTNLLYPIYEIP